MFKYANGIATDVTRTASVGHTDVHPINIDAQKMLSVFREEFVEFAKFCQGQPEQRYLIN